MYRPLPQGIIIPLIPFILFYSLPLTAFAPAPSAQMTESTLWQEIMALPDDEVVIAFFWYLELWVAICWRIIFRTLVHFPLLGFVLLIDACGIFIVGGTIFLLNKKGYWGKVWARVCGVAVALWLGRGL